MGPEVASHGLHLKLGSPKDPASRKERQKYQVETSNNQSRKRALRKEQMHPFYGCVLQTRHFRRPDVRFDELIASWRSTSCDRAPFGAGLVLDHDAAQKMSTIEQLVRRSLICKSFIKNKFILGLSNYAEDTSRQNFSPLAHVEVLCCPPTVTKGGTDVPFYTRGLRTLSACVRCFSERCARPIAHT